MFAEVVAALDAGDLGEVRTGLGGVFEKRES